MKKISIFIIVIGLVGLFSCKKDETKAILSATPGAPLLTLAGGDSLVLHIANSGDIITYTWTPSDFGQTVVTNYTVQVDKQGDNFQHAVSLGIVTNATTLSITVAELNNKLLTLEFDPDHPEPLDLEFRVKASVSTNIAVFSAAIKQVISPYFVKILYPLLFVPGNYQGWNAGDSATAIPSIGSNDKYEGYLWIGGSAPEYKYDQGGTWDVNWGDTGGDGILDPNGDNIKPGNGGYYRLKVDLPALTHSYLRTEWSVIGDATPGGWNTDTDMAYDSIAKVWRVTVDLTAAAIKFRANHDWALNYGDTGPDGKLEEGGDNILVPEGGNYTVTLNLSGAIYRYKLEKN